MDDEDDSLDTGTASTWYQDRDADGYGDAVRSSDACIAPSGYTDSDTDCDDADASVNPGAAEVCDEVDNDCDGDTDEDDALDAASWYTDADIDGYGDYFGEPILACDAPSGAVADNTDCDDSDASVNPGVADYCVMATPYEIQTGVFAEGDILTVVGLVAHDDADYGFHLLDETGGAYSGLWIYHGGDFVAGLVEGDEVMVRGEYTEYYDLTELWVTDAADVTVLDSGQTLPAPTVIDTSWLASATTAEPYEGCLVQVESVSVVDTDLDYGEWSVDDDAVIDDLLYTFEDTLVAGASFDSITGLLYYSYSAYKIEPRDADDFVNYSAATYSDYLGWETLDYGYGYGYGFRNCSLYWDAVGTPATPCPDCLWAFDVAMSYDTSASYDDGACSSLTTDTTYSYAYSDDYYGYSVLMMEYSGTWYAWIEASFDGSTFEYASGYLDYPYDYGGTYPGYYYTYYWAGEAEVY